MPSDEPTTEVLPDISEESQIVYTGDRPSAEVLKMMLDARGLTAELIGEHQVETGALVAAILVPGFQAEDARALIADFESGAAARK